MNKINVKVTLKNNDSLGKLNCKALKKDGLITYFDDLCKVIIKIGSEVSLIRENSDYKIELFFNENLITNGSYFLKKEQVELPLKIFTTKLLVTNEKIELFYSLEDQFVEYTMALGE